MKRDMELIRKMILMVEDQPDGLAAVADDDRRLH